MVTIGYKINVGSRYKYAVVSISTNYCQYRVYKIARIIYKHFPIQQMIAVAVFLSVRGYQPL